MDELIVPDHVGWVVGVRGWHILYPGFLVDANRRTVYTPRERQEAHCVIGQSHEAPNGNCSCGFYLIKPSALTKLSAWKEARHYAINLSVWGFCYGWGKVIEHEYGWRVQYTYPKELYDNSISMSAGGTTVQVPLFSVTADRYGVSLFRETFQTKFPQPNLPPPKPTARELREMEREKKRREMEEFKAWLQQKNQVRRKKVVEQKCEELEKLGGG